MSLVSLVVKLTFLILFLGSISISLIILYNKYGRNNPYLNTSFLKKYI